MYQFNREDYDKRMEWYRQARFGMFIHWGLYAIPARGEWLRSTEQIPKEEYMKYFYEFDPRDYDPKKWARAAKNAGMKYVHQYQMRQGPGGGICGSRQGRGPEGGALFLPAGLVP